MTQMIHRETSQTRRLRIEVSGVVQGVGFRPYVYNLARAKGLKGYVMNASAGVIMEVEGDATEAFLETFRKTPPPLSKIMAIRTEEILPTGDADFRIRPSLDTGDSTHISPDVSVCDACLSELLDPGNRRYLYPFINCTHCGPRYSITTGVPYDRPNTTMAAFAMCPPCLKEYQDPADRRFHAQPNACPACGPHVEFVRGGRRHKGSDAVEAAIAALKRGLIVAVKGLGGFHLAADAEHPWAVDALRRRKRKNNKAFALMAPDIGHVKRYCRVSRQEEALLVSRERPIVLLRRRGQTGLHDAVAPGTPRFAFMLPYTPLHGLLFLQPVTHGKNPPPNFRALVMTSGNLSEEPIVKENGHAVQRLAGLADAFLFHNRDIFLRVDDSVVRRDAERTLFVRRARGYVPGSIPLGNTGPEVLACGADLKNTFALTKGDSAIVSQHIGDLENFETLAFFEETLTNLKSVYRVSPEAIAYDLHPGYFSTRWALGQKTMRKWGVQHHYAHIASVMAEEGLRTPVIGAALDGAGYGPDRTVWGGEFLVADLHGFTRKARFKTVPLPGGESAARRPWIMAVSYLYGIFGEHAWSYLNALGHSEKQGRANIGNVIKVLGDRSISPLTSSAGRLFDAVSSLLGLVDINTYEGEAAMALEAAAAEGVDDTYPYTLSGVSPAVIDFSQTLRSLLADLGDRVSPEIIAARFHNTVAEAAAETVRRIHEETGIVHVALSGGVFQNGYLLRSATERLHAFGLIPHTNSRVPCNDGGISLGQAYLLRERLRNTGS